MTTQRGHRSCLPMGDPRVHPASPGRPPGRPGPLLTTSHDDDQVQVDPPLAPARPVASFEGQAPTSSRRHAAMDTAGDHADPAIPAVRLPAPPPQPVTSCPSDTADAATHGRRGPDTGHLDAQTPAPDTGHVDRHPWDTGRSHRTLDTGCRTNADTVTTAPPASGPPWPPRRATAR
jgi:hypothetical protein